MEVVKTCPICFDELKDEETASPDICDHKFCLKCLQKWAKREKVCPVDRKRFKKIINLSTSLPILIKPRKRKKQPEMYDVTVHCEVCSKTNNEETLILCDCCDLGFHCKCLVPPLKAVPSGVWHCPMCVAVSEKIRLKKGITKDVELIFTDHINSKSSSSESDNSSDKSQKISLNSKRSKCSNNSSDSGKLKKRFNCEKKASTCNWAHTDVRRERKSTKILFDEHSRRLRPRMTKKLYTSLDSSSSSEENIDIEKKKSYFLRNKNFNPTRKTSYIISESSRSSCSSEGVLGIELKENYSLRNKNQNYLKTADLTSTSCDFKQTKPLDLTLQEKKHEDFNFSFKTKHSIKKTFPEATITSGEINSTNGLNLPDIVIEHTISLKSANELNNNPNEESKTDSTISVSIAENNQELLPMCSTTEDTCIIKEVRGKQVTCDDKKEHVSSPSKSENDMPVLNDCNVTVEKEKCYANNFSSNEQNRPKMPILSVFEKLEDDNSAKKKYFDIDRAVNEKSSESNLYQNKSGPWVMLPHIASSKHCSDKTNSNNQETKNLSKEISAMQKKKWKTYHMQHQMKCNCTSGLHWCHKHSKNREINSVQIGHQNKYSEHYNKLLSVARPFIKKPKWNQHDIVILKNVRKKTGIVYSSDNCSSSPNYNPYMYMNNDIKNNQSKEVISMNAKDFLKLKDTEKNLLKAVMCTSNIDDLAVRPDGTLFVNWKND